MKAAVIKLTIGKSPETPSENIAAVYVDAQGKLCVKDARGVVGRMFYGSATCKEGTETLIEDKGVAELSVVLLQARDNNFVRLQAFVSSVKEGEFVVEHDKTSGGEAFDYLVIT